MWLEQTPATFRSASMLDLPYSIVSMLNSVRNLAAPRNCKAFVGVPELAI
jgi:hypothetical protein